MRKTIWKGCLLLVLAAFMNISVQAAYFACSGTLENPIQLTRVVERTMFSSGYRIASASNATASNANAQEASPANASASNAQV